MDVWRVDAAGFEEADGGGDAEVVEDGESFDVLVMDVSCLVQYARFEDKTYSGLCGSALCARSRRGVVEGEDDELLQGISREQSLTLRKKTLETFDGGWGRRKVTEELRLVLSRCRRRRRNASRREGSLGESLDGAEGCKGGNEDFGDGGHDY